MTTSEFLSTLRERDVRLWVEDGRLKCDAPPGVLQGELREQLAARRAELIELVGAAEAAGEAARSVVPLKPSGERPALFARPGHNGDVFCYRGLARHFDPGRPLYGVEPQGLDGSPTAPTIEAMARYEAEQIRKVQPQGPYHLAGYCAGGAIAFETARQLVDAGEDVARVLLFGSPFPHVYRDAWAAAQLRSLRHRARKHAKALTEGSAEESLRYVRTKVSSRRKAMADRRDPALENRRRVEVSTVDAVRRYDPGFYPGRVDVFLPNEAWRRSGDRPDDWKRVAAEVVEHTGPDTADGDTMLHEPHVRALAALVNPVLTD